jgi:NADH-quinone oxidoreductase subunit C
MSTVEPETTEEAQPEQTPPAEEDRFASTIDALKADLGDAVIETGEQRGDLWVRVDRRSWKRAAEVLRHQLGYDYFCFLSGIDWMPHTWPNPKIVEGEGAEAGEDVEAEPEPHPAGGPGQWQTGFAGGDSRFQVLARVYSTTRHAGVFLKADLDDDAPQVETWSTVYRGADWHERETWEMYGFDFVGHPHLVHIYLPSEFEGFPLRKDFPLLSREVKPWPGLVDVEGFPAGYGGDDAAEGEAAG